MGSFLATTPSRGVGWAGPATVGGGGPFNTSLAISPTTSEPLHGVKRTIRLVSFRKPSARSHGIQIAYAGPTFTGS